ncbi:MAG: hypothetical protein HC919_09160 [Oscillatoriales cyanobacterium SM2_2_1]|nr:hypothetical protein [Oscillatoriales cyanobacterium SM2_2_1]
MSELSEDLWERLRRKQGTWLDWADACQVLQRQGESSLAIFEHTGFEPIQQNQIMVAAQVYRGLGDRLQDEEIRNHFAQRGSDILYELRILSIEDRSAALGLIWQQKLDVLEARELARAMKESRPDSFSSAPGDAIAYQVWKACQARLEPVEQARLIAKGLKFAQTPSARTAIEKLLSALVSPPPSAAPRLPLYRYDADDPVPRVIPMAGDLPLPTEAIAAIPLILQQPLFGIVHTKHPSAWIALPGWHVVRDAEDPVALTCTAGYLEPLSGQAIGQPEEPAMLLIDRAQRTWQPDGYFLLDQDGVLALQWSAEPPEPKILGRLVLVVRPKRFFDESAAQELWQVEE